MSKLYKFLKEEIWRIPIRKIDKSKSFWINQLRIVILAMRGFSEDKCLLRASALTFYTLLSIVPVLAMAFGIAKGFGIENFLEKQLHDRFEGHEQILEYGVNFARRMLENTSGGVIAGIGLLILFWTIIKLLENIENSFNDIWGVKEGRSIGRKFSDYLALMLICPILLALAGSVTLFIAAYLKKMTDFFEFYGIIKFSVNLSIRCLPFLVTWLLFSFMYAFLPNTSVKLRSAIFAGFVAGIFYQLTQYFYISSQFALSKYNAVYGSFAALPFFLVWVQTSWFIVLFGAELSFAAQNVDRYEFEPDCRNLSPAAKFVATVLILSRITANFERDLPPPDDKALSTELDLPIRLVREILFECHKAKLISEVKSSIGDKNPTYQPSHSPEKYTVGFIASEFLNNGLAKIENLDNSLFNDTKRKIFDEFLNPTLQKSRMHIRELYDTPPL